MNDEIVIALTEFKVRGKEAVSYGICVIDDRGKAYVRNGWPSWEAFKAAYPTLESVIKDVAFDYPHLLRSFNWVNGEIVMVEIDDENEDDDELHANIVINGHEGLFDK
jgi:hypothetical protein